MDRQIVYPGSIPLDSDILSIQRNTMVAMGYLAQAVFGTTTVADGFACVPFGLGVLLGTGSITQYGVVDSTAFGSLAAASAPLLRIAANLSPQGLATPAPVMIGQSITYVIQASFFESDSAADVLPYYNAANPGQPFSGANNSGTAQNTQRLQTVQFMAKAGASAPTGSQVAPGVDAGWVGLYAVVVSYGQGAVVPSAITPMPGAPFITYKLPQLTPGTSNQLAFHPTSQGFWTVPAGVTNVRARVWGGGGAGGAGFGGAGGGGAGGGHSDGFYAVSSGQRISVIVGNGGTGSGSDGGTSNFGNLASANGGNAGANGASGVGGVGGSAGAGASGHGYTVAGTGGGAAFATGGGWVSGSGGSAFAGAGAVGCVSSGTLDGHPGIAPGGGGAGGIGTGLGGAGGAGLVVVEW